MPELSRCSTERESNLNDVPRKKWFVELKNAKICQLAPLGARRNSPFPGGARAKNGELAVLKCTKVKSIMSILPDPRVSLSAEVTSNSLTSKKSTI